MPLRLLNTFTMVLALTSATALSAPTTTPAPAPDPAPNVITVIHICDPRLPTLSTTDLTTVLTRARTLIHEAGGPDVTFSPPTSRPAAEVQQELLARHQPLPLALDGEVDPASVSENDIRPIAGSICRAYGTVPQLRSLLGLSKTSTQPASYTELATVLSENYVARLKLYASLKNADNSPTIGGDAPLLFRLSSWSLIEDLPPYHGTPTLTLYNGFAYEDVPENAGPHSLYTAQAFGLTEPPTNTSLVAYHFLLKDIPIPPHHLGSLTPDQRLDAIAYVIAHEVGNHLLLHLADDFASTASIARPLASLAAVADLYPKPVAAPTQKRLPTDVLAFFVLHRKADLAIARHDVATYETLQHDLNNLDLPAELKLERRAVLARLDRAVHN